jgi:hypothetical protein
VLHFVNVWNWLKAQAHQQIQTIAFACLAIEAIRLRLALAQKIVGRPVTLVSRVSGEQLRHSVEVLLVLVLLCSSIAAFYYFQTERSRFWRVTMWILPVGVWFWGLRARSSDLSYGERCESSMLAFCLAISVISLFAAELYIIFVALIWGTKRAIWARREARARRCEGETHPIFATALLVFCSRRGRHLDVLESLVVLHVHSSRFSQKSADREFYRNVLRSLPVVLVGNVLEPKYGWLRRAR